MPYFKDWTSLAHTAIGTLVAYAFLIVLLRSGGKRTLSKLNAFDLVITVALGSTLASVVTSSETALANGLVTLSLLVLLQVSIAWLVLRLRWFEQLVKGAPTLVMLHGRLLQDVLRLQRIARDDVLAAVRGAGILDLARVHAVVLETDGSLSVLPEPDGPVESSTLEDVEGRP